MVEGIGLIPQPHQALIDLPELVEEVAIEVFPSMPPDPDDVIPGETLQNLRETVENSNRLTTKLRETGDEQRSLAVGTWAIVEFEDLETGLVDLGFR